ncbi:ABC transporter ATP-binding protein [Paroceanicella profunda]|uniref:ABC transporter ATP-binding protein n=1 Tax=Paroceanicella profunda TaxID=2579971 RepID=A0A5B8FV45_9RHOB|nr:ABC transporter ATP-binding protein [Paroceanicella profunda]QDL91204.1 ABC transporter ATP-binding protein [Paroceanicella profunda]
MSIHLNALRKSFSGSPALRGLSADIPKGAFFTVLGPSGCGKSTLLRLVAGLETLDSGGIALAGRPVAGPGVHVAPEARGVAVVFQSYALWPHMSVRENVAFPIETAGASRAEAATRATKHLDTVALTPLAERKPAELSGGQRQRVALARCLASRAATVLMDEPLANLDPHLRGAMEEELTAFHRASGATLLYITHDQREAMALSDLVAVMEEGRFLQVAPPEELHDRPVSSRVAGFVGTGAVIPAEVLSAGGARAQVRLGNGLAAEVGCRPGTTRGTGTVLLRPGQVRIAEGGLPARLESVRYRGGIWEGRARPEGWASALPVAAPARLTPGETVPLRVTGGWLLPEG